MKKIAINGFGRIGRLVLRRFLEVKNNDIQIVAINDLTDVKILAHLFKFDSAHGQFQGSVETLVEGNKNFLVINGHKILALAEADPKKLPWKQLEIDVVAESTGRFTSKEAAQQHIDAGAKKVVISAPAGNNIKTIVYNVNHNTLTPEDTIISAASCTTNALAPVVNVLEREFGISHGYMTTVHAYTADQRIQDAPHSDLRRARAAAANIVPSSTGAAKAIGLVIPSLSGKMDGFALRVPVITGSFVDLSIVLKKQPTVEEINAAMKKYENESFLYNTFQLVSSDIIGDRHGSIFDATLTKIITSPEGERLYKVFSWYDNEFSFVSQYVRLLILTATIK